MEQSKEIEAFSWEFFKIIFDYIMTDDEMLIVRILLIILVGVLVYATIRNTRYAIAFIKNIIKINKPIDKTVKKNKIILKLSNGKVYKDLDKDSQKQLLQQGLLLTLPISTGLIIVLLFFPLIMKDLIIGIDVIQSVINFIGLIGMTVLIYVFCNHYQDWFLHQLITNKCKISIETVTYIKEDYSKDLYIKVKNRYYKKAYIQYIDTENNSSIPTLYRSVDRELLVGSKVFIIELVNGKKYALTYKQQAPIA